MSWIRLRECVVMQVGKNRNNAAQSGAVRETRSASRIGHRRKRRRDCARTTTASGPESVVEPKLDQNGGDVHRGGVEYREEFVK